MEDKYSVHGYVRLWIPGSANEKRLKRVRDIIDNKSMLRETFERIFDKEQEKEKP